MNACDHTRSQFSDYLDKLLAPDQESRFETHLANCSECRLALQQVTFLSRRMQNMASIRSSADFDQTLRAKIMNQNADPQKPGLVRNMIIGTSSVAVIAALTFFAISTVNTPDMNPSQNTISRSTDNTLAQPVVQPQMTQPTLASESQANDSLSKTPAELDPNKIKLVDQHNRQP